MLHPAQVKLRLDKIAKLQKQIKQNYSKTNNRTRSSLMLSEIQQLSLNKDTVEKGH